MPGRSDDYRDIDRANSTQSPPADTELLAVQCFHRSRVTKIGIHAEEENWFEVIVRDFFSEEIQEDTRQIAYPEETEGDFEEEESDLEKETRRFLRLPEDGAISIERSFHNPELMIEAGRELVIKNHNVGKTKYAVNIQLFEQNPFRADRRTHPIEIDDQDGGGDDD